MSGLSPDARQAAEAACPPPGRRRPCLTPMRRRPARAAGPQTPRHLPELRLLRACSESDPSPIRHAAQPARRSRLGLYSASASVDPDPRPGSGPGSRARIWVQIRDQNPGPGQDPVGTRPGILLGLSEGRSRALRRRRHWQRLRQRCSCRGVCRDGSSSSSSRGAPVTVTPHRRRRHRRHHHHHHRGRRRRPAEGIPQAAAEPGAAPSESPSARSTPGPPAARSRIRLI